MAMITVLPLELTSCGAVAPMTSAVYACVAIKQIRSQELEIVIFL